MDLQEWELLPDDGFLEIHDDGGKKIFCRKYVNDSSNMIKMNYFAYPSSKSAEFVETLSEYSGEPKQLLHLPIQLEPKFDKNHDDEIVKEVPEVPVGISIVPSATSLDKVKGGVDTGLFRADHDPISQVFFKKVMENEKFADMKLDPTRSNNIRGVMNQLDPCTLQFEEKENSIKDEASESEDDDREEMMMMMMIKKNKKDETWKWSLSSVGAICSFGIAAATVCIIYFGGRLKNKQHHQQTQKLQFHIYTDDKRIKGEVTTRQD